MRMRRHARSALVIAVLSFLFGFSAHPASADWQFTRWGMPLAELLAIKDRGITAVTPNPRHRRNGLDELAHGLYMAGSVQFKVGYLFDGAKRLSMVVLSLENATPVDAEQIRAALVSQYGYPPVPRSVDSLKWTDDRTKNQIQFIYLAPLHTINILYEPLRVGGL